MYRKYLLFSILLCNVIYGQINISGYIIDKNSGEKLIGSAIVDSMQNAYTVSNNYGYYSLQVDQGYHHISVLYVGYSEKNFSGYLSEDTIINFQLNPGSSIEEVKISGLDQNSILSTRMPGLINLPVKMMEKLPFTLGEQDVLKTVQLMPGVQPGSEGLTGYYVRGGDSHNNLILLDGMEVFNSDHMFGFFSFFNPDVIKTAKFYKSGFPAKYNGRTASILDVRTKDGNENVFKARASIGLLASKVQLEGPLIKKKLTFILSARRTYIDLFSKQLVNRFTDFTHAGYYFIDLNGKIRLKINEKNNIYLSNYYGYDDGYFQSSNVFGTDPPLIDESFTQSDREKTVNWGSNLLTARYERVLTPNLFMNVAVGLSNYDYYGREKIDELAKYWINDVLINTQNKNSFTNSTSIKSQAYAVDFDFAISNKHRLKYGSEVRIYQVCPYIENAFIEDKSKINPITLKNASFFIQDEIKLGNKLMLSPGLNYNTSFNGGKSTHRFDKRFLGVYDLNRSLNISTSFTEATQYLHLLRLGRINLASDLWLPSHDSVKPLYSREFAAAITWEINASYTLSVEGYIRTYENILYYNEGLVFNNQFNKFSELVTSGKGYAKGLDFALEKSNGRLTGIASYTLSDSEREIAGLNNGEKFRSRFDRPHNFKVLLTYSVNKRWSISGVFNIMSGSLQTLPVGKYNSNFLWGNNLWSYRSYISPASDIIIYKRNSVRLPVYHRLDLSVNYSIDKQKFRHSLHGGLYNAYNAKNAYELQEVTETEPNGSASKVRLVKKVLFPVIPFINYIIVIK